MSPGASALQVNSLLPSDWERPCMCVCVCVYFFLDSFPIKVITICCVYSLCYAVGLCCLPVLYVVLCIC